MLKSTLIKRINTKLNKQIYMDFASATPIDIEVQNAMSKISKNNFANDSAIHKSGVESKMILEKMRENVAKILFAHKDEIIFTSGATESNNLAILGVIEDIFRNSKKGFLPHILTTNIEHSSVLEVFRYLEKTKKAEVSFVEVEENGIIDVSKLKKNIKSNTVLISVMYANNEIGTIQPIKEISKSIRHFKKNNQNEFSHFPIFHTDATQAINYLSINVEQLGVDLLSFNGSKIYGPKGVGVLYIKRKTPISSIMFGGDQEYGFRPGTENLVNIVGISKALEITQNIKDKENKRLLKIKDYFIKKISEINFNDIKINGDLSDRLPNNINITISNIPSDLLVIELASRGIMVSEKSACKTGDGKFSYVISAINKNIKETDGSIRFSLGRQSTKQDIDFVIKSLREILKKLNKWYN